MTTQHPCNWVGRLGEERVAACFLIGYFMHGPCLGSVLARAHESLHTKQHASPLNYNDGIYGTKAPLKTRPLFSISDQAYVK